VISLAVLSHFSCDVSAVHPAHSHPKSSSNWRFWP